MEQLFKTIKEIENKYQATETLLEYPGHLTMQQAKEIKRKLAVELIGTVKDYEHIFNKSEADIVAKKIQEKNEFYKNKQ